MFNHIIRETAMTSCAADNYFGDRIIGNSFRNDKSFVSTARALLGPRIGENKVYISFNHSSYDEQHLKTANPISYVFSPDDWVNTTLLIHSFNSCSVASNTAWLQYIEDNFERIYPEWHRIQNVTEFYRKAFKVLCFVDKERKKTVLFCDNLDLPKVHYLQCGMLAYLPWYFDRDQGITEQERALIESLRRKDDGSEYLRCIAVIAEQYNFREMNIRTQLAGFETFYEREQADALRKEIDKITSNISDTMATLSTLLRRKSNNEASLLGLETKINSGGGESEIMEYFLGNKELILDRCEKDRMIFSVRTYLEYWDEDMAQSMIDNPDSYVYIPNEKRCNNIIPAEEMKKLMYAIFIDQKLRIRFCSSYTFSMPYDVFGNSSYGYDIVCEDCMPNPHIDRYACLGTYNTYIAEFLNNRNYIGAIEQCVASARSLNFGDSCVMQEFMCQMYGISDTQKNNRCIELPDGTVVTPKQAVAWMNEQEG